MVCAEWLVRLAGICYLDTGMLLSHCPDYCVASERLRVGNIGQHLQITEYEENRLRWKIVYDGAADKGQVS